jgi:hypothetical protein
MELFSSIAIKVSSSFLLGLKYSISKRYFKFLYDRKFHQNIFFSLPRYMTRKIALCLMSSGWIVGFTIAAIPLVWNKWDNALDCEFDQIFYPWYMVGIITPVFSLVWFTMFFVYCRIWREASKQVKQLRVTGQQEGTSDWKSVQVRII